MSNISAPSNFVSLSPDVLSPGSAFCESGAKQQCPRVLRAAGTSTQKKVFERLANSDFPDAQWNLGGVFLYDNALATLCDFRSNEGFANPGAVAEVHGAPPCPWTLEWFQNRPLCSPSEIVARLKAILEKRRAKFVFYFDNPFVPAGTLEDSLGSVLLNLARQMPEAGISVASELLAEHIRAKCPEATLRAGANKAVVENGRGNADYYFSAAEKYAVVALHPDDALDFPLLEKLSPIAGKIEITVNDSCLHACALRERHLAALAKIRENPWCADPLRERHKLLAEEKCEDVSLSTSYSRSNLLARAELKKIYALGFRRFRIQAQALRSEISFFYLALQWLFSNEPENWHYKGLVGTSLISKIQEPAPAIPDGLRAFVRRKYD